MGQHEGLTASYVKRSTCPGSIASAKVTYDENHEVFFKRRSGDNPFLTYGLFGCMEVRKAGRIQDEAEKTSNRTDCTKYAPSL